MIITYQSGVCNFNKTSIPRQQYVCIIQCIYVDTHTYNHVSRNLSAYAKILSNYEILYSTKRKPSGYRRSISNYTSIKVRKWHIKYLGN